MKEAAVFTHEADFRRWFEQNLSYFGVREIVLSQEVCPDYVVIMQDGQTKKLEAELFAANFKYHRHRPARADYIVACYSKTRDVLGVPVMAVHNLWCFDLVPLDPLPPDDPLSDDEARLLTAIFEASSISISALSQGELAGDQEIWLRIPPDQIKALPHRRIPESVLNSLTQAAKEWLRKYHHLLIGAGLSQKGCQLLESLGRRQLIEQRPINLLSSIYDGVFIGHPAWMPVEVRTTPLALKHHRERLTPYASDGLMRHILENWEPMLPKKPHKALQRTAVALWSRRQARFSGCIPAFADRR